jgi:hypothetical protein
MTIVLLLRDRIMWRPETSDSCVHYHYLGINSAIMLPFSSILLFLLLSSIHFGDLCCCLRDLLLFRTEQTKELIEFTFPHLLKTK